MNEYTLIADTYDFLLTPFLRGMRKRIVTIADELKPQKIVDLCCGTGHQLKLLKKAGFNNLLCVDVSKEMLNAAGRGKWAPKLLKSDAADTGLPADSVDLVIISLALHEKTRLSAIAVLSEAVRLLKPGAALAVCDYSTGKNDNRFAKAAIRFIEFLVGGEHYVNYRNFMSSGGLPPLLEELPLQLAERYPSAGGGISVELWLKK